MNINLTQNEIRILQGIAKKTGMDTWFYLDNEGKFCDLDRETKSMRKGVKQLVEGMTCREFESLCTTDQYRLLNLVAKMI